MKKFLVSVADVYGYDENDTLLFVGKTLMDSSIETSLSNTDVRGGRGAQLQYVYYHSGEMTVKVTETQWNLAFLSNATGSVIGTGADVYYEEDVTLGALGAGTVTYTPVAAQTATIYGWVTLVDGTVEKVTFSGKNFTCSGAQNDVVCVRYYRLDAAARTMTIPANIIPKNARLVLDAQLASSDESTNVIGKVEVIIPKATFTGKFTINMKSDGVSDTPLEARALAFTPPADAGCGTAPVYAYVNEIITGANWYDDVIALAWVGGDFGLTHPATKQTGLRAVHQDGTVSIPPFADLTLASSDTGKATINSTGLVTTVATGTTNLHATITAKTAIDATIVLTVS